MGSTWLIVTLVAVAAYVAVGIFLIVAWLREPDEEFPRWQRIVFGILWLPILIVMYVKRWLVRWPE